MKPVIYGLLAAVILVIVVLGVPRFERVQPAPEPARGAPAPVVVAEPARFETRNLLANGSFEKGADPGDFAWYNPGNPSIAHWQVITGQIDYVGSKWPASDGHRSIDLNGSPGCGGVSQQINVEPGATYRVRFDLAGNPCGNTQGANPVKSLRVEVICGSASTPYTASADSTRRDIADLGWIAHEFTFEAAAELATIRFHSLEKRSPWGPVIDNVRVHRDPA